MAGRSEQAGPEAAPHAGALARSAAKVADSAGAMKVSASQQTESADRRTVLAADRTVLAAERTYAAWVRTGLAALASGVGARALLQPVLPGWLVGATGTVLILFSAFCFFAAVWREFAPVKGPPDPEVGRLPRVLLIAVNGFLGLVAVAALIGVWFGVASGR